MAAAAAAAAVASSALPKARPTSCPRDSPLVSRPSLAFAPSSKASPTLRLASNGSRLSMSAGGSNKDVCLMGPAGLAILAAAVIPEIAEAAAPGVSPSLKNLLFSVIAGGVVLVALSGAVAAVSTFDPVKRK